MFSQRFKIPTAWKSRKYLDKVAAIETCMVQTPACNSLRGTIVPAHSDQMEDGKGKGIKSHDMMSAACCHACHDWLHACKDKAERDWYMDRGIKRTIRVMVQDGVINV